MCCVIPPCVKFHDELESASRQGWDEGEARLALLRNWAKLSDNSGQEDITRKTLTQISQESADSIFTDTAQSAELLQCQCHRAEWNETSHCPPWCHSWPLLISPAFIPLSLRAPANQQPGLCDQWPMRGLVMWPIIPPWLVWSRPPHNSPFCHSQQPSVLH